MAKIKISGVITVLFVICKYIECDNTQKFNCIDLKAQHNVDTNQVGIKNIRKIAAISET